MKNLLTTALSLALMMSVAPAWADDKEKQKEKQKQKCPESAATCATMMKEHFSKRGWVGINMDYHKDSKATVITNVIADSPGERAGFEKGDVLRGLNGVEYTEENEKLLKEEYGSFKPGGKATFKVERDGKTLDLEVSLESIPEAILAQWVGQHVLDYHEAEAEVAEAGDDGGDESP